MMQTVGDESDSAFNTNKTKSQHTNEKFPSSIGSAPGVPAEMFVSFIEIHLI